MMPRGEALLRSVWHGRVRWAIPHRLVEDGAERVVLYVPVGTRGRRPRRAFVDYLDQLRTGEWDFVEHVWHTSHVLRVVKWGAAHSIDHSWADDGSFRGWYVNLQAPFTRSPLGFDTRDQALDLVIDTDGGWRWKDEDHLRLLTEAGAFTADEAAAIRAEGERVLAEWPFPTGWEDWRPDPAWPLPALPEAWHVV